jgi:ribosomal protein L3 glutamine methyltransferase
VTDTIASDADDLLTVRDVLRRAMSRFNSAPLVYGHGTETALDEAAFLILESLNLPVDDISPWLDARLTRAERLHLLGLIERRVTERLPAAYLVGRTYIQGVPFKVDRRVIIPRSFIGELLFRPDLFGPEGALVSDLEGVERVLDLCTGSGCLAILAAHAFPNAFVDAVELSEDAAAVAAENIEASGLADRITLHRGDLYQPLDGQSYDLILTNPPYVDAEGMASLPLEALHEPRLALDGGADGLTVVRRILDQAEEFLNPGGALMCEVGRGRAAVEAAYPALPLLWLDTETSEGEVFWAKAEDLDAAQRRP